MFYYFLYPLKEVISAFNVFRYITFRAAGCGVTAFILSVALGPYLISLLRRLNVLECSEARGECRDVITLQAGKQGTPTMGGVLIVLSILISSLLWTDLSNPYVLAVLFAMMWLGFLGFIDDALKLIKPNNKGLAAFTKFAGQLVLGIVLALWVVMDTRLNTSLEVPFMKHICIDLGIFYIPFVILVIVGSSNAVNLTDGLDGLAVGCMTFVALTYGIFSYISGHSQFSEYLQIAYLAGSSELLVVCVAMIGAGVGFLWFNSYPATVFMGDTGSLALGGMIGTIAILIKKELLLVIVGGVFVMEAVSVILQIAGNRFNGKRPFKMAPIHHHFQLSGIPETKITVRLWIIAALLAIIGLATLKLR